MTLEESSASSVEINQRSSRTAETMHLAVERMNEVDERTQRTDKTLRLLEATMAEISGSSEQTAQMIQVIDSIALQTNILALNAAVESARAGEAGAGFAVVADEVRALAQKSTVAAKTSAELIERSVERVRAGRNRVAEIAEAIRAVTESAAQAKTFLYQADAGEQAQAKGVATIARAFSHLETMTHETAASAEVNAAVGQGMQTEAKRLIEIVETLEPLSA